MLDRLPTAEKDKSFTETTIAMVAADLSAGGTDGSHGATGDIGHTGRSALSRHGWKVLLAMLAGGLGFLASYLPGHNSQRVVLRDMPVVQNMDHYRYAGSVEFIELLRAEKLFDTDSASQSWSHSATMNEIRDGIANLTDIEKRRLTKQRERFDKLSPQRQEEMRQMHGELVGDANSSELFATILAYREWLKSLSSADRADLLDIKDLSKRVQQIQILKSSDLGTVVNSPETASDADLESYYLNEISSSDRDELMQMAPDEMYRELRRWYVEDHAPAQPQ